MNLLKGLLRKQKCSFDVRLDWFVTMACNLRCDYCTLEKNTVVDKKHFETMCSNLIRVIDKTNKIFKINITGGEPFIVPSIIDTLEEITKKHFISLNTNLSLDRIKEFAKRIDVNKVSFINASLHIKELEKRGLLNTYIENFCLLRDRCFNINFSVVSFPPLANEASHYLQFFNEKGIRINFVPFLGQYNGKEYPNAYTKQELERFKIQLPRLSYYFRKGKICNAGYNFAFCWEDGNITPCLYKNMKKIGTVDTRIELRDDLMVCPYDMCGCPIWAYEPVLLMKSLLKTGRSTYLIYYILYSKAKNFYLKIIDLLRKAKKWI